MARTQNLGSMSVEELLKLRDDVGKVLGQKAVELEKQLSMLGTERGTGRRGRRNAMRGRKGRHQVSRQGRQHVGWPRGTAGVAAREIESRRQARGLCRSTGSGFCQSFPAENKEAPAQEVMRLRGCCL